MIIPVPTEIIPIWYIEKWKRENAESGSALEHFLEQLVKDWHIEKADVMGGSLAILTEVEKELEETRKELYGNNDA